MMLTCDTTAVFSVLTDGKHQTANGVEFAGKHTHHLLRVLTKSVCKCKKLILAHSFKKCS